MGIIQNSAINLPNQIEKKNLYKTNKIDLCSINKKEFIDAISWKDDMVLFDEAAFQVSFENWN